VCCDGNGFGDQEGAAVPLHQARKSEYELKLEKEKGALLARIAEMEMQTSSAAAVRLWGGTPTGQHVRFAEEFTLQSGLSLQSNAHCIGTDFTDTAWKKRSCTFRNLCFDPAALERERDKGADGDVSKSFVFFKSASMKFQAPDTELSLSMGALNVKWGPTHSSVRWDPEIREAPYDGPVLMASNASLWMPYHSMCAFNPGHLMWDEFYPWYLLQHTFSMEHLRLRPLRIALTHEALWATCDWRKEKKGGEKSALWKVCPALYNRFLPSTGIPDYNALPTTDTLFSSIKGTEDVPNPLVCFPHSAMGMGMMSDHCLKEHGHTTKSYKSSCNHARGRSVWEFRNAIMRNFGLDPDNDPALNPTENKIVISSKSSRDFGRNFGFEPLHKKIAERFPHVPLELVHFSDHSAEDQLRIASSASVIISAVGGGTVTSMFLPRGAALLLTYPSGKRLDFDMWVNAAWLRVQWFQTSQEPKEGPLMDEILDAVEQQLETFTGFHARR
jgi:hypothetical protein